jgi:hypothetical protein
MMKNEILSDYYRLLNLKSLSDCNDLADIFLEHLWNIINIHGNIEVPTYAHKDAYMINQMMFTKLTHLQVLLKGVGYKGNDGANLNNVVDPTVVATLVRNVFETTATFNLIFRQTNSDEEMMIIYNLWSISGLNYRQRFESGLTFDESKEKLEDEKKQIDALTNQILESDKYKKLVPKSQEKILSRIDKKDYRIVFNGNRIKCYTSWQDLCEVMNLNKTIFENIYTYFSLYSHPSQVAVFQFEDMFQKNDEAFKSLTAFNLKYCFTFLSIFIADYVNLFQETKNIFEALDIKKQVSIDALNILLRGDEFAINDAKKKLENQIR